MLFSTSATQSTRSSWHPRRVKTGSASWSSLRGKRGGRQLVFSLSLMRLSEKYASTPTLSAEWRLWKQPQHWLFSIWKSQALASAFFKPKWSKKLRNDLLQPIILSNYYIYIMVFCPFLSSEGGAWMIYPYFHMRYQKIEETLVYGRFFGRDVVELHHLTKLWLIIISYLLVWSLKMYIL